ncbi:protein translocase subunit SecE [Scardovia inopinata]|uniref:Protein translocase subunit SecE n=1 Tax=Scardovia inopinata F0304 TaxID=641146 RepID=W5IH85_SCAIO|nr:preprotein translocase subunit SecE [Scardovia inopinata]EFG26187.1 preprotein translocase, SecE subunit [Scardovia inopinata F0304]BAR07186.1 preprotein translocase subunit SecE [Scardovia inopinata JCM 12537]SUV51256.1 protein translocase subunit SecE [Scardovia inopinata]
MAESSHRTVKEKKPNIFMRIGQFIKQVLDEMRKVVAPSGLELLKWSLAVFIFVLLLMLFTTGIDFGLGKLMLFLFG